MSTFPQSLGADISLARTSFRTIETDGVQVFYREAGPVAAPVVFLLHGFPSSSHMFRELIPRLASKYRAIATLQNIPEFHRAFQCKPGDAMVRPAAQQCKLW